MIKELIRGEHPSLLDTDKGNEVIKAVNSISTMRVSPEGAGRFVFGEGGSVLDLTPGINSNFFGSGASRCAFQLFDVDGDIGVTWGTINGMQPTDFAAGSVFTIAPDGTSGIVYAKATADTTTLQWTAAEVVVSATALTNTTTIVYTAIGSYSVSGGVLSLEYSCGNVTNTFCQLAAS